MSETSIHFWDADAGEDESFPVTVYSDAIPKVGDEVHYWVDYPRHMPDSIKTEPGQPVELTGRVSSVRYNYRYMRGWGNTSKLVVIVSVFLTNYQVTLFPFDKGISKEGNE
jgi:hypothetical protein